MAVEIYKQLSEIYSRLQDDESREIFRLRSLYAITGKASFFEDYVKRTPARRSLEIAVEEKPYIFGCGVYGRTLCNAVKKNWLGFSDNNKSLWGGDMMGRKVYPPHELPEDATVYLAVKWHQKEIKGQLLSLGLKEEKIVNVGSMLMDLSNRQYFDELFLPHAEEEVFVDIGCLNGETARNFITWAGGKYRHIYCFEADPNNARDCREKMKDLLSVGKVTLVEKAAAAHAGILSFQSCGNGCSKLGDGDIKVETVSLDDALAGTKPTFIKMDIEGGEYEALKGAARLIREQHPKLAISVYHLPADIFDIPALILSYYPDYKFYLRHYSPFVEETVLYAI